MDDLVAWLRTVLDEDERATRTAWIESWAVAGYDPGEHRWCVRANTDDPHVVSSDDTVCWVSKNGARAEHIARWDPVRVLAEVEAKRAVLDLAEKTRAWTQASAGATAGYASVVVSDTLRLLALPYHDRPGYRPEWAPEAAQ